MPEHEPDGAGGDAIVEQLRRYAAVAGSLVPPTPERGSGRHVGHPFLAAAAVIVVVAGGLGTYLFLQEDRDTVESGPADPPAVTTLEQCAGSGPDGPDFWNGRSALPFAASAVGGDEMTTTEAGVQQLTRRFAVEDLSTGTEVEVTFTALPDRASSTPDLRSGHTTTPTPVTLMMCDPFAPEHGPAVEVDGLLSHDGPAARLTALAGFRWGVAVSTNDSASVTDAELVAVAQGTIWPSASGGAESTTPTADPTTPTADLGTPGRPDSLPGGAPCTAVTENQPEIEGMRITHVPSGFEPTGPSQRSAGGPLDTPTSGSSHIELVHPDGRWIRVVNFWSDAPEEYVETIVQGTSAYQLSLLRCRIDRLGEPQPEHVGGVRLIETPSGIVVAGQDQGHGGFVVEGGPGVTRDEVLAVASGLR